MGIILRKNLWILLAILSWLFVAVELLIIDFIYKTHSSITFVELMFWSYIWVVFWSSVFFFRSKKSINKIRSTIVFHKKLLVYDALLSIMWVGFFYLWIYISWSDGSVVFGKSNLLFSLIIWLIFLKESVSTRECLYAILMLVWFILFQENSDIGWWAWPLVICISSLCYVIISYLIKKEGDINTPLHYTYLRQIWILVFISIIFILFLSNFYTISFIWWENIVLLIFWGISGSILARSCTILSLKRIKLYQYTILHNADMLLVFLWTLIFLDASYDALQILGMLCVFWAIILSSIRKKSRS